MYNDITFTKSFIAFDVQNVIFKIKAAKDNLPVYRQYLRIQTLLIKYNLYLKTKSIFKKKSLEKWMCKKIIACRWDIIEFNFIIEEFLTLSKHSSNGIIYTNANDISELYRILDLLDENFEYAKKEIQKFANDYPTIKAI